MKGLAPLFLVLAVLLAGCSSAPDTRVEGAAPAPVPPIVGTWLSQPREPGGVRDLYLFKDSRRSDAAVVPGTPGETLSYEVQLQGTWEGTKEARYLLVGEEITHFFTNDSHSSRPVRDLLRYDARDDRLYRESDPGHPLERISQEAVIPSGMNVSIPWD
jgi:hypothetical protein